MAVKAEISVDDIKEIIEIGVDNDIPHFTMDGNWYQDYAMDSLGAIAVVVEVQKRFDVRIPDEAMHDIYTGNLLVAAIEQMQQALAA